jgi:hypothetical protein
VTPPTCSFIDATTALTGPGCADDHDPVSPMRSHACALPPVSIRVDGRLAANKLAAAAASELAGAAAGHHVTQEPVQPVCRRRVVPGVSSSRDAIEERTCDCRLLKLPRAILRAGRWEDGGSEV